MKNHKINILEKVKRLRARGIYDPFAERLARMFKKAQELKAKQQQAEILIKK